MTHNILIFNADTPVADALTLDLLMCPPHREKVDKVWATVRDINRSGTLAVSGAFLIQMSDDSDESHLIEYLKHVDSVVLIPDCFSDRMVEQAETIIRGCRKVGVRQVVLHSRVGIDGARDNKTAEDFRRIEKCLSDAKIECATIVRTAPVQQSLFMFRRKQLEQGVLRWSCKPDARLTLVNFVDIIAVLRTELTGNHKKRTSSEAQVLELTGSHAVSPLDISKLLSKVTGKEVRYERIDRKELCRYFAEEIGLNKHFAEECLDQFEIVDQGLLNKVSKDIAKIIDHEPVTLQHFIEEHAQQFKL